MTHLINLSITQGIYPDAWNSAIVTQFLRVVTKQM